MTHHFLSYYNIYETSDKKFLAVGALENKFFSILIDKLGLNKSWILEQTNEANWPQLSGEMSIAFLSKTRDEWGLIFDGSDACVEPVLRFDEVEKHPQNKYRGTFFVKDSVLQANQAPKFSRTPPTNPKDLTFNMDSILCHCIWFYYFALLHERIC